LIKDTLLYDLFEELKNSQKTNGPGLEEYYLFLDLIESNKYPLRSFNDLAFVLETIWLKSYQYRDQFRSLLEERRNALRDIADKVGKQVTGIEETKKNNKDDKNKTDAPNEPQLTDLQPKTEVDDKTKDGTQIKKDDDNNAGVVNDPEKENGKDEQFGDTGFSLNKEQRTKGEIINFESIKEKVVPLLSIPYVFSNDYLPVKSRHLQQAWRQLKSKQDGDNSDEINFSETIKAITDKGYFSDFRFDKEKNNQLNLFVFLDQSETMIAVEEFGEELVRAAIESNLHPNTDPWFFYKVPQKNEAGDYLLTNKDGTDSLALNKVFSKLSKKDIVVLIYSDAGTFINDWDEERIDQTTEFINHLFKTTSYVVWVNPAPQDRWPGTNSAGIYEVSNIPMYECTRNGIDNAIAGLKGKLTISQL